ncbi:MAG TPA: hypothetical protein DCL44_11435 [Elusimicrobia bacterium]|nr:hypothetical protein [Elusimicrobiota bacterium]
MFFPILLGVILAYFFFKALFVFPLWLNRNLFSKIWHEEKPVVDKETIKRIKELCVDDEVSEETAVLMTARETGESEQNIYAAFDVSDARELVSLLAGKKPGLFQIINKAISKLPKKGMGG